MLAKFFGKPPRGVDDMTEDDTITLINQAISKQEAGRGSIAQGREKSSGQEKVI